jgi:DNA-binding XRE family transcriptional regulator
MTDSARHPRQKDRTMPVMTKSPAGDEIVILSRAEYESLLASRDEDEADAATARARLSEGAGDTLTSAEVDALLAAPTPLAFWRKKRGLTQQKLATAAGVGQGFLSEIEAGKKTGDVGTLKRIAEALALRLDDLVA